MQTILVFLTFALAVGFMVKKFIWNPFGNGKKRKLNKPGDHSDCSKCSFR